MHWYMRAVIPNENVFSMSRVLLATQLRSLAFQVYSKKILRDLKVGFVNKVCLITKNTADCGFSVFDEKGLLRPKSAETKSARE